MIDYELLGAMIGSAWRENHRITSTADIVDAEDELEDWLGIHNNAIFTSRLSRTMQGCCAFCGSASEVGRRWDGVYICRSCMEFEGQ